MPTRSSLVARCGATLLLVMFAAACSSGAASSPAGAGPTLAAGTTASPAASSSSGGGTGSAPTDTTLDVCAIFPVAAAAKASGLDLTSAVADPAGAGNGCTYSSSGTTAADSENHPDAKVYTAASSVTLDILKVGLDGSASQDAPTVAISGVGDKAYAGADGIIAQSGSYIIEVSGLATDLFGKHATSSAIASALLAALK
jgi:hypothetical protein